VDSSLSNHQLCLRIAS